MDDQKGHRLEAAAESTFAKLVARFGTPLMLGVIGWFLVQTLHRVEQQQAAQGAAIEGQSIDLSQIQRDMAVITTRMDERVIRQVGANSKLLESHEERLRVLERTTRTP